VQAFRPAYPADLKVRTTSNWKPLRARLSRPSGLLYGWQLALSFCTNSTCSVGAAACGD
jgi:hypothetical protein